MKPDQQPKYLNTSEGEVFHKGRIVYGADLARAAAAKAGRVVLVEGYTDVIALHQAGVPEVVGQMGTALTAAAGRRAGAARARRALLCLDPDSAGQASAKRGLDALSKLMDSEKWRTRKVDFRVVRLPSKQDPADVVAAGRASRRCSSCSNTAVPVAALRGRAGARAVRREHRRAAGRRGPDDRPDAGQRAPRRAREARLRSPGPRRAAGQRGAARRAGRQPQGANGGGQDGGWGEPASRGTTRARATRRAWNGNRRGGGGRDRFRPIEPPEPADPRTALIKREQSERAYLAYCLALPDEGERRLAEVDLEDYFSAPGDAPGRRLPSRPPARTRVQPARTATRRSPGSSPSS